MQGCKLISNERYYKSKLTGRIAVPGMLLPLFPQNPFFLSPPSSAVEIRNFSYAQDTMAMIYKCKRKPSQGLQVPVVQSRLPQSHTPKIAGTSIHHV